MGESGCRLKTSAVPSERMAARARIIRPWASARESCMEGLPIIRTKMYERGRPSGPPNRIASFKDHTRRRTGFVKTWGA